MTEKRPIDANELMARFFRKECLMRGHNAAASAAYKDAQKTVVAAPTVSLWPEWRDPDKDPPKVETEVLVLVDYGKGYCITTAFYEDGTVSQYESVWQWEDVDDYGIYDEEDDLYRLPKGW